MNGYFRITALIYADIVVELAFFEIWSMQTYLTGVWKMSITHAAAILNIWEGIAKVLPICFVFLVDTLMGNFLMLVLSSILYSVGLSLLFTSSSLVRADCQHYDPMCVGDTEKIIFYTALALIAVGISGHRVSLLSFRNEQLSKANDSQPKISELIFPLIVPTIGGIGLPFVRQWQIRFGIPAICVVVAILMFLTGICTYKKSGPQGKSPLTTMCRVFVASASNISQPLSLDDERFYKKDDLAFRTSNLRCLDKAAIIIPDISLEEPEKNRWRLCTVEEVEETKSFLRVVPVWMTFIVCGIVSSFANTYFQEQANHMDNKVGKLHAPPIMFLMLQKWMETISEGMYIQGFRRTRQSTKKFGLIAAMIFSVLCCITAARVEMHRLSVVRRHGLVNKPDDDIPMSIFWLLLQIWLLAMTNSFIKQVTYDFSQYDTSESFSDYSKYFAEGMNGVGYMCGPILVEGVGKISEKGGKTNWFQHTLNGSRLDKYYWAMAVLCSVNLLVCIFVVFTYKARPVPADREESSTAEASIH